MRTAAYAGMRYFPAHRFTSATIVPLFSRLALAWKTHYHVESSSDTGRNAGNGNRLFARRAVATEVET